MKIASWNVNSIKVRLPQLLGWLAAMQPDVLVLQETKCEDVNFPRAEIEAAGYQVAYAGQKTYNGVALLARAPISAVCVDNPLFPDPQRRLIAATVAGLRVVGVYVPNGQALESEKFAYKMNFLDALHDWLCDELQQHSQLVLGGDFNIVPSDADVYDPLAWADQILCSAPERKAFRRLLDLGLHDSFRLFAQPAGGYSWWDYRQLGFQKNRGLRIDHLLVSNPLAQRCDAAGIDRAPRKQERPSDHAPVWLTLAA